MAFSSLIQTESLDMGTQGMLSVFEADEPGRDGDEPGINDAESTSLSGASERSRNSSGGSSMPADCSRDRKRGTLPVA